MWYARGWGPAARRSSCGPLPAASSTDDPWASAGATQRIPWLGSAREEAPVFNERDPRELADCLEAQRLAAPEPYSPQALRLRASQAS
eukprot:10819448-Lingulodinium_polyedra.AAC.1